MTDVRVLPAHFHQKEEAIAEIMNDGYWPISWVDKPGCSYAPHRHRDDETLYIVAGSMEFSDLNAGNDVMSLYGYAMNATQLTSLAAEHDRPGQEHAS